MVRYMHNYGFHLVSVLIFYQELVFYMYLRKPDVYFFSTNISYCLRILLRSSLNGCAKNKSKFLKRIIMCIYGVYRVNTETFPWWNFTSISIISDRTLFFITQHWFLLWRRGIDGYDKWQNRNVFWTWLESNKQSSSSSKTFLKT